MKMKPILRMHGLVMLPVEMGKKVHYCQNGMWKTTGKVKCILEENEDYVKFETEKISYYINYFKEETGELILAA